MKTLFSKCLIAAALTIMAAFFAVAEVEAFTAQVESSKMTVYSESGAVLGTLEKGTAVNVLDYKDGSAYIECGGKYGYAAVADMKKAAPALGRAAVKSTKAKIYIQPSTSAKVMCSVKKGSSFVLVSKNKDWACLQNGKLIGYAKLSDLVVTVNEASVTATPTVAPTPSPVSTAWASKNAYPRTGAVSVSSMVVRSGPDTSYPVSGTVAKNTEFLVHAVNGDIAYIEMNGKFGFCRVSDFKYVKIEYGLATVKVSSLNVYASKTTDSKMLGAVKKGKTFTVLDYDDTWVKLENGSLVGYAKLSGLTLSKAQATPAPTPTPTPAPLTFPQTTSAPAFAKKDLTGYKEASSKTAKLYTVKTGEEFTFLGSSGAWALIKNASGTKAYCALSSITLVSDATIKATTSSKGSVTASIKLYKYAASQSKVLTTLNKGAEVTVLGYNDLWAYVQYGSTKGYCALKSVKVVQMPTLNANESLPAIITKATKAYKYAISSSDTVGNLSANAEITVLAHNDAWALVQSGSKTGYVAKSALVLKSDVTMSANQNNYGIVQTAGTVYKYMYSGAASAGSVKKGVTVNVLNQKGEWALIQQGSNTGYFPLKYLTVIYDEFVNPTSCNQNGTIITQTTLYKMAIETSDKLGTLKIGASVTISAYTSKWAKVTSGSSTGYVLRSAISTTAYTELKGGSSSGSEVTKLQKALENLGYFDGVPAGNYGSITQTSVKRFQTELGLEATGIADANVLRVIYSGHAPESPIKSVSLSKGSTGTNVTRLQTRLTYKGYLNGSLDGDFGAITEKAVKLYQKTAGLPETGVADVNTMKSLFSSAAPTNKGSAVSTGTTGTASTGNWSTNADDDPAAGTASEKIETVIEYALAQLGKPYIYGTSGTSSYDCSGLTCYCYKKVGISLGRSAYAQGYNNVGTKITGGTSNLKRGDLVCLNTLEDSDLSDHVGIYLGGGKFVHASSSAGKVIISSISTGYYNRVFSWGRRLL